MLNAVWAWDLGGPGLDLDSVRSRRTDRQRDRLLTKNYQPRVQRSELDPACPDLMVETPWLALSFLFCSALLLVALRECALGSTPVGFLVTSK